MGRRAGGGVKPKKRKKVTVQLIKEKHAGEITEPYKLLSEIRGKYHGNLDGAKIALAWRLGWRPDANNILTLGRCRKRGDLDRELDSFDFVILINKEAWNTMNDKDKRALIDHELCHAQIVIDADGQPKTDDRDRLVCRVRKHDIEEFKAIVERHGCYTQDLAAVAHAAMNDARRPLLGEADKASKAGDSKEAKSTANPADWRGWSIDVLGQYGMPAGKVKLLAGAFDSMGKLCDRMNQQGAEDHWWKDIKGFGESGYNALVDAVMAIRKSRPEFQAEGVW